MSDFDGLDPDELERLTANWTPQAKARAFAEWERWRSTNRRAWYCSRGRTCDGQPHPGYPYKHARADQYPPVGNDWLVWAMFSGRGCVAPETRIWLPELGEHIPIADLRSEQFVVGTRYGPERTDGPAFRKGIDDLWKVTLSDSRSIQVTKDHRFLTPRGWRTLSQLSVSHKIAVGGARPEDTTPPMLGMDIEDIWLDDSGHNIHYRRDTNRGSWRTIIDIQHVRNGEFWDLTVPDAEHYAAEGIWNHNSGKTRTGAEWLRAISSRVPRMAMVGRRGVDVRATLVEGESGLISVCENAGIGFDWQPSKREFTFNSTGAKVYGYSGEEPDSLRGPQHGAIWFDEPAHMPLIQDVWDNALLGLRLPGLPGGAKALVTTTPLPTPWIRELEKDPGAKIVRVSTYENLDNLDPAFRARVLGKYEGTRLGRQELHGEILEDVIGALWKDAMFRLAGAEHDNLERIVVAIDPAGSVNQRSDETGIVVAGVTGDQFVVLEDFTDKYTPNGWAERALDAYQFFSADAIIAEKNFGGDMVRSTIENAAKHRGEAVRIRVATATRGKQLRAEPVVSLYEQGRVVHMRGLQDLETEMVSWVPGIWASPNRVDALVWAITELHRPGREGAIAAPTGTLRRGPLIKLGKRGSLNLARTG